MDVTRRSAISLKTIRSSTPLQRHALASVCRKTSTDQRVFNAFDLPSMIVCAAVIGQTNRPLYIRCYGEDATDATVKFNYIVHCALDAVEEKILTMPRKPNEQLDSYLGLLYPTEDFRVYGFISSTNTKFVLVFDDLALKEDDVKLMFSQFYQAYVNAVSNPFYTFGTPLKSSIFDAKMEALSKGVA